VARHVVLGDGAAWIHGKAETQPTLRLLQVVGATRIARQHGSQECTGEQLRPRLARKADTEPGR